MCAPKYDPQRMHIALGNVVNRAMHNLGLRGEPQKREKVLSPSPGVTAAVALQLPADRAAPYELAHEKSRS